MIFWFNLDCTFFRDLNQVRSTSLKLDKYFSSFVQEKCSIEISFLSYISTIALFLFLERIVLSSIYLLLLSIDTLLVGIYFFCSSSCGNENESQWSFERELVFTKDREKLHEVCKLQERKLTSRARDAEWLGNL